MIASRDERPDGRPASPLLVRGRDRVHDRAMTSSRMHAFAARSGRRAACANNVNRNNASLPRAGD